SYLLHHLIRIPFGKKDSVRAKKAPVERRISRRRGVPGEILRHALPHDPPPALRLAESLNRGSNRAQQRLAGVFGELEPCAIFDGIIQTAGGANYRHGAV